MLEPQLAIYFRPLIGGLHSSILRAPNLGDPDRKLNAWHPAAWTFLWGWTASSRTTSSSSWKLGMVILLFVGIHHIWANEYNSQIWKFRVFWWDSHCLTTFWQKFAQIIFSTWHHISTWGSLSFAATFLWNRQSVTSKSGPTAVTSTHTVFPILDGNWCDLCTELHPQKRRTTSSMHIGFVPPGN